MPDRQQVQPAAVSYTNCTELDNTQLDKIVDWVGLQ